MPQLEGVNWVNQQKLVPRHAVQLLHFDMQAVKSDAWLTMCFLLALIQQMKSQVPQWAFLPAECSDQLEFGLITLDLE